MRVGITTRNPGSPVIVSLCEALKTSGHEPVIIHPEVISSTEVLPAVQALIVRMSPDSQARVLDICRHYEQQGIPMTASALAVEAGGDKSLTCEVMARHDIPMPGTWPIGDNTAEKTLESIAYPAVIKLANSNQGKGVMVVESLRSARSVIDTLLALGQRLIVQEYIEAGAADIRIIVVGGRAVAAMRRTGQKPDEFRSNITTGGRGEAYEPSAEEVGLAVRACAALDCAIAGVDIIVDRQRGPLLLEVNPSHGFAIQDITGLDIMSAYMSYLESVTGKV